MRNLKVEKYQPTVDDFEDENILKIKLQQHETHPCLIPGCEFCEEEAQE